MPSQFLCSEWAARAQEWDAWRGTTLTNLLQPEEEAYFVDAASALRAYRKAENLSDLMFALRIDLRRSGTFEFMHRRAVLGGDLKSAWIMTTGLSA